MSRLCVGIGLLLALAIGAPGPAQAAKAPAKVVISHYNPPPIIGTWHGQVKSERKACKRDRQVILYRREGEKNANVGFGMTQREGNKWVWAIPADEQTGRYFALAPPTDKCKRAESEIFRYPGDNPPMRPF
ncbi:MAG: hypothetical protein M3Y34_02390 [Actinomycetota bacterium]|nr:hypothetical protein [Actinomycetota bacterium]